MSDGFEKQTLTPNVPKSVHANDLSMYFWWSRVSQLSRLLDVLPSLCENAVNLGLTWRFSRWSDSSACSTRTQGAMKTGPVLDESSHLCTFRQ